MDVVQEIENFFGVYLLGESKDENIQKYST